MKKRKLLQSSSPTLCDVSFFDCTTRFLVTSQSRPDEVHLVDLNAEDRGRFECSCEDWLFRNPDWIQAPVPYECKHIWATKQFVLAEASKCKDFKLKVSPDFQDEV